MLAGRAAGGGPLYGEYPAATEPAPAWLPIEARAVSCDHPTTPPRGSEHGSGRRCCHATGLVPSRREASGSRSWTLSKATRGGSSIDRPAYQPRISDRPSSSARAQSGRKLMLLDLLAHDPNLRQLKFPWQGRSKGLMRELSYLRYALDRWAEGHPLYVLRLLRLEPSRRPGEVDRALSSTRPRLSPFQRQALRLLSPDP